MLRPDVEVIHAAGVSGIGKGLFCNQEEVEALAVYCITSIYVYSHNALQFSLNQRNGLFLPVACKEHAAK